MIQFELAGTTALVTGGSRGLGRAIALALAEAGADVAIAGRDAAALATVAEEIKAIGRRAFIVTGDITDVKANQQMVHEAARQLGRLDILVNNAGINIQRMAFDVSEDDWDRVLDTNLKGPFFTAQAAGQIMREQPEGGRIISIGSQMSHVGYYKRAAYCSSKGGLSQLTKVLAIEWAPNNILVNCVAPTFIETPMTKPMLADPAFKADVLSRIPLGRVGQPKDVAGAVLYLASNVASMVTGHTLLVDGGWTAW